MWCKINNRRLVMGVVHGVLAEEYERLLKQEKFYSEEISKLPKGSILEREISGGIYHYLKFREGKKVRSIYIRDEDLEELENKIKERKRLEKILKSIREDEKILKKVVKR